MTAYNNYPGNSTTCLTNLSGSLTNKTSKSCDSLTASKPTLNSSFPYVYFSFPSVIMGKAIPLFIFHASTEKIGKCFQNVLHNQGHREPARAPGYFIAPGSSRFPKHQRLYFIKLCPIFGHLTPPAPLLTVLCILYIYALLRLRSKQNVNFQLMNQRRPFHNHKGLLIIRETFFD